MSWELGACVRARSHCAASRVLSVWASSEAGACVPCSPGRTRGPLSTSGWSWAGLPRRRARSFIGHKAEVVQSSGGGLGLAVPLEGAGRQGTGCLARSLRGAALALAGWPWGRRARASC